jgi:protein SCO1/2
VKYYLMKKRTLFVGISSFALIAFVTLAVIIFAKPASFRGATFGEPYPLAPEIELTRSDGSSFRLSEMRGNVILVFFGYTSCPDVCPTTLAELKLVLAELSEEDAARVKVLFVTVDPKRDTPERVQEYVDHFNKSFIGVSGTEAELEKVWQAYGVFRLEMPGSSASGYTVDHTARVTLIDQDGNMRVSFGFDTPVDDVVHDLKLILK